MPTLIIAALFLSRTQADQKVSFEFPPTPLPKLLARLQPDAAHPYVCSGNVAQEMLAAKFTEVTFEEARRRLAETLRATWTTLPDGSMRLARTVAQNNAELNEGFDAHTKTIREELAKIKEPEPLTPDGVEALRIELHDLREKQVAGGVLDYTLYERIQSLSNLALSRLIDRVAKRLNPNFLARLPQFGSYPLVPSPVGTQLSTPEDIDTIIDLWRSEVRATPGLMGQGFQTEEGTPATSQELDRLVKNGMPFLWIQSMFGQMSVHVKIVGKVGTIPGQLSISRNIGTNMMSNSGLPVSAFGKSIAGAFIPSERTITFTKALAFSSQQQNGDVKASPIVRSAILGYQEEDPLAVATGDFWQQLGASKKSDYLVRVPDLSIFFISSLIGQAGTLASLYAQAETSGMIRSVEHPGYFALIPVDPEFNRRTHIPRPELAALVNRFEVNKVLDIDTLSDFIGKTNDDFLAIFGILLAASGAGAKPDMALISSMDGLRLYGRLPSSLRQAARQNGADLRLDSVEGPLKVACDAVVYRSFAGLRGSGEPPSTTDYAGFALPTDVDPLKLPAIQFPTGYPGGSILKIKLGLEPHLFQVTTNEKYTSPPMITEVEAAAASVAFARKFEEFGTPSPYGKTSFGYGNAEHLSMIFNFPTFGRIEKHLRISILDGSIKFGDISTLPPAIRKELETQIAKTMEIYKNMRPEDFLPKKPVKPPF